MIGIIVIMNAKQFIYVGFTYEKNRFQFLFFSLSPQIQNSNSLSNLKFKIQILSQISNLKSQIPNSKFKFSLTPNSKFKFSLKSQIQNSNSLSSKKLCLMNLPKNKNV